MATGFMVRGSPTQPKWVFVIRVIILVLTVIVMGLTAWAIYLYTNPYSIYSSSSSYTGSGTGSSSCYYFGTYICRRSLDVRATIEARAYTYYYTVVSAPALMMFALVFTLILHAVVMGLDRSNRGSVFRLPVFIAYIFDAIFLLSGWAYMASHAAAFVAVVAVYERYGTSYFTMLAASTASAAGLGAILW